MITRSPSAATVAECGTPPGNTASCPGESGVGTPSTTKSTVPPEDTNVTWSSGCEWVSHAHPGLVPVDGDRQLLGVDRGAEDARPDLSELLLVPAQREGLGEHQTLAGTLAGTTWLRSTPIRSISHSTVSPGFRYSDIGSSLKPATPDTVPIEMRSPREKPIGE